MDKSLTLREQRLMSWISDGGVVNELGVQMKIRGLGGYSRRDAAKSLSILNESLARSLNMAFKQAVIGKDFEFIKLAHAILNDLGGPLRHHPRRRRGDSLESARGQQAG